MRRDQLIMTIVSVLGGLFILYFLWPRQRPQPQPLDLGSVKGRNDDDIPTKPATRELGVVFQYNGHSWEAYEVLGLPAGANSHELEKRMAEIRSKNTSDLDMLETAYNAIKTRQL